MSPRRIYSELLPYDELVRPATLDLLRRYPVDLVCAVRPHQLGDLPRVVRAAHRAEIPLSLWPMLANDDGRWASVQNASLFAALVRGVMRQLDHSGLRVDEVLLDLEPPFRGPHEDSLLRLVRDSVGTLGRGARDYPAGATVLSDLVSALRESDVRTMAAVWPPPLFDGASHDAWQRVLGTPVDRLRVDHVSVMAYTTIFEGWTRGAVRRKDAVALLSLLGERTTSRWPGAGLSLGCVGTGAFGDEPVYRGPFELAEDVAVARAAGCEHLALFDLAGVLSRPPPEAWLEAFVIGADLAPDLATGTSAVPTPRLTRRAECMVQLAESVSTLLGYGATGRP